jgi:hypothetical protein
MVPMQACIDEQQLLDLTYGTASDALRYASEEHAETCERCRELLDSATERITWTGEGGDYSTLPPQRRSGKVSTVGHIVRSIMSLAFLFFFISMANRAARRGGRGGRGGMGGLAGPLILGSMLGGSGRHRGGGFGGFSGGGGFGGGGFGGFGGGGGFSGGGASGGW